MAVWAMRVDWWQSASDAMWWVAKRALHMELAAMRGSAWCANRADRRDG